MHSVFSLHTAWVTLASFLAQVEGQIPDARPPEESFFGRLLGSPLGLILLIVPILYFFWFRPESRRTKSREAMLRDLKKGDQVITSSGIIGRVHRADEKEVVIQVDKDSNVKVRFLKSAVSELVTSGKNSGKGGAGSSGAGSSTAGSSTAGSSTEGGGR